MDPNYEENKSPSSKASPPSVVRPSHETDLSTIVEEVYRRMPINTTPVDGDAFLDRVEEEWNCTHGIEFKTSFDTAETTELSNASSFDINDNDAENCSTRNLGGDDCVGNDIERGRISGSTSSRNDKGKETTTVKRLGKSMKRHTESDNAGKGLTVPSPTLQLLDPSLILSMERTLFSALNVSWLFALGGIGLMAIGNDDVSAMRSGITMIACSMIIVAVSFLMHLLRLNQLRKGNTNQFNGVTSTIVWTGIVSVLLFSFLGCELYFGIQYPYLQRTASVSIENVTTASSTATSSTGKRDTSGPFNQEGIDWDHYVFTLPSEEPTKDPTEENAVDLTTP
eukprot:CAMPEP_0113455984 /NCGR_PEP_ID=MMETSP0014_2-20120614/8654_1 /TAXON_ID=2857 /ORGANISM="Nitzschia sp." /LENGTH=338 /DNA_ID=CAMNT_0000347425 /DNA_START=322 /DNA_END=1338 /DNA_ORIENTATION=+ /assembly_acc=CAM_ASM_000159